MKFVKKLLYLSISLILLLFLCQVSFAEESINNGKIRLGKFILLGLEKNINDSEIPDWFKPYVNEMMAEGKNIQEYVKTHELWVTKEQAADITILYSDDLLPLMITPDELGDIFTDFSGIEYLHNLKSLGTNEVYGKEYVEEYLDEDNYKNGINSYLFSREQVNAYYKSLIINFKKENAKELWPNLNFDTLRTKGNRKYDIELQNYTKIKINEKGEEIIDKIENANLSTEDKQKLKDIFNLKVTKKIEEIKSKSAYDLSSSNFISEFEIKAKKEFEEFEVEIRKLEKINISVKKLWSDNSNDKNAIIKLLKKKTQINIGANVEPWENVIGDDGSFLSLELNESNGYKGIFSNLPKYEKDGKTLIEYNVYEAEIEGYTVSISGNQEDGFVVTNNKIENIIPDNDKIEVIFINDGIDYAKVMVEKGNSINRDSLPDQIMPDDSKKENYTFKEWNTQIDGNGEKFTGETKVTKNITVYAVYEKIEQGNEIKFETDLVQDAKVTTYKFINDKILPKTSKSSDMLLYIIILGLTLITLMLFIVKTKRN